MAKKKQRATITKLADLERRHITVIVERDDDELEIPCKTLTWKRWQDLGVQVPDPAPPIFGVDRNGRPQPNYNDPTYLAEKEAANTRRLYLRLLDFLDIDIPGDTPEARMTALQDTLEVGLVNRLASVMGQFAREGEARIETRAATFHDADQSGDANVPA